MFKSKKKIEWVRHILKEGARNHVIRYDTNGIHCNVINCEINEPDSRHAKELRKNCIKKIQTNLSKTKNINKKAGGL